MSEREGSGRVAHPHAHEDARSRSGRARLDMSPGAALGRYVILHSLGAGGMGVIYKAYDTELDRNVALKILRIQPDTRHSMVNARIRLQREAQALAQLSHPNVITVYDVGTFGEQVFVAMELVEGQTLREWLDGKKRTLPEILDVFVSAARGLAAAHEANLIHRDFKPSNVMIGNDGRLRILDFGLARGTQRGHVESEEDAFSALDTGSMEQSGDALPAVITGNSSERLLGSNLTELGAVVGTPAYMSPEQHLGRGIGARSDQFAFCVTLYQALYGRKPFAGKNSESIKRKVLAGQVIAPPSGTQVPRWLHRIVLRGLEVDPEKRYPSMNALLVDLDRDLSRKRRFAVFGALGAVVLGAGVAAALYFNQQRSQLCQGSETQLASIWNQGVADEIATSFLGSGRAHAAETHERVVRLIDEYGNEWVDERTGACEATHKRGEQSEQVLDLRMVCLASRLRRLDVLVHTLAHQSESTIVDDAIAAVLALPSIDSCANVAALARAYPLPTNPEEGRAVKKLEAQLDQIETSLDIGQGSKLLNEALEVKARSDELAYPPVQSRAYLLLAAVQELHDQYEAAEASLHAAARAAAHAHDDESTARAWIDLVKIIGFRQGRVDDALAVLPFARTAIVRAEDDALLGARLARSLGWVYSLSGDYGKAQSEYEQGLRILQNRYGANSLEATRSRLALSASYGLAGVLSEQAEYEQALAHYERIRDIVETHFGAEHMIMVSVLGPLAENLSHMGRLEEATVQYRRALDVARKNGGGENARAALLEKFAQHLVRQRKLDEARERLEQALSLRTDVLGPGHVLTAEILRGIVHVLTLQGAYGEAEEVLERAGKIFTSTVGTGHPGYAGWLVLRGDLFAARELLEQAQADYEAAIELMAASLGETHPITAEALTGLGTLMQRRAQEAESLAYHTQARDILAKIYGGTHLRVGEAELEVARGLLLLGRYEDARASLEHALGGFEAARATRPELLAQAYTGLAESALGVGDPAAARIHAEQALALWGRRDGGDSGDAFWARFLLARAKWELELDRASARQAAEAALMDLQQREQTARSAAIRAWLSKSADAGARR